MESTPLTFEDTAVSASPESTDKIQLHLPSSVIIPSPGSNMLIEAKNIFNKISEYAGMGLLMLYEFYPDLPEEYALYLLWKSGGRFEKAVHYLIEETDQQDHDSIFAIESKSNISCESNNVPSLLSDFKEEQEISENLEPVFDQHATFSTIGSPPILSDLEGENQIEFTDNVSDLNSNYSIQTKLECMICFGDLNGFDSCFHEFYHRENAALRCDHVICRSCCKQHLEYRIKDGKVDRKQLTCPIPDCNHEYNWYHVLMICDIQTVEKLIRFRVEKAYSQNPFGRWCCNTECESLIIANPKKRLVVCTLCKQKICYKCGRSYHIGPCLQVRMPTFKDFANTKWKLLNKAKTCPQCHFMIVKSHGCNHMTCAKCGYEFCWLCKKAYTSSHFDSPFSCSSYRSFNIWGPNTPVRVVTKTVGGTVLISFGVATIIVASPYLVWKNKGRIKSSIKGSLSSSSRT